MGQPPASSTSAASPVVERHERADSGFQQGIDEAAVVIDAFGVHLADPAG